MAAEKFIFKNFADVTKTDSFCHLKDNELSELIHAAMASEYCSTNEILVSLHGWVVATAADQNTQSVDERINTFMTLVKKLPWDQFDEKTFGEIFLNDHRLRDNAICRSFRDEYLCDFFKKHIELNTSDPRRGIKRKADGVEEEETRESSIVTDDKMGKPAFPIEITSGQKSRDGTGLDMTALTVVQISGKSSSTVLTPIVLTSVPQAPCTNTSTSAQKSFATTTVSHKMALTKAQILGKSSSTVSTPIVSTSVPQAPRTSTSAQKSFATTTVSHKAALTQILGKSSSIVSTPIVSTSVPQAPRTSTSAQKSFATTTVSHKMALTVAQILGKSSSTVSTPIVSTSVPQAPRTSTSAQKSFATTTVSHKAALTQILGKSSSTVSTPVVSTSVPQAPRTSTSAQKSFATTTVSHKMALTVAQILGKSSSTVSTPIVSTSVPQAPRTSTSAQKSSATTTVLHKAALTLAQILGKSSSTVSTPIISTRVQQSACTSTNAQQFPRTATRVEQAAGPATEENRRETSTGSIDRGKSKRIISGGNGKDYIGYFTSKASDGTWFIGSFNLATGDVEKITDLPCYRENGALIYANNYLYFIGGRILRHDQDTNGLESSDEREVSGEVSRRVDIFDMTTRNFITENLPQLNEAREDFLRCVFDGHIHIMGGNRTDGTDVYAVERIPVLRIAGKNLHQPDKPSDEYDSDDYDSDNSGGISLYCLNGDIYHIDSGEWTTTPKIPGARTGHTTTIYKSKFYVFGGLRTGVYSYKLASACVYNIKTKEWTMLPNMKRKRFHAIAVCYNKFIYIIGGDRDNPKSKLTIEKFDPATNEFELIENWLNNVPRDVNFYLMTWVK